MGRLKHEALREEVHCFDDLKIPRGCSDRQRPDRSAAMHMLQCNISPVLIFRPLWSRRSVAERWKCAALSRPAVRKNTAKTRSPASTDRLAPSRLLWEETSRSISSDRPVIDADVPAAARDQLGPLDGCEDCHRVLLQVLVACGRLSPREHLG